jgi:hypothetical protein
MAPPALVATVVNDSREYDASPSPPWSWRKAIVDAGFKFQRQLR